ncbi:MAG: ParB/RepB/Spo0J family partition protein [Peptostreptococcaceae bacterium]|nr:ParB/RepB/Spo0J family partition protein [Peptostreptococcaceae bacterium]
MNEIIYVQTVDIKPNPHQPRKIFLEKSLSELSDSIKKYGVIQPLTVRKIDGSYELIAGERRLRAAEKAGLDYVPVLMKNMSDEDSAIVALVENLQREDLDFVEEAIGYQRLMLDYNMKQQDIARYVGKNQSTIANKLRLLKLSDGQLLVLRSNGLTERHGRALLKLNDEKDRDKMIKEIIKNDLNVRQTETAIEKKMEKEKKKDRNQTFKSAMNMRIYTNTIKNAFKEILKTGVKAEYEECDKGIYYEIRIKIPINKE